MSVQIREKSYFGEKFRVVVYCPIPKHDNSELGKCIFYGIVKILIETGFWKKPNKVFMFSELKALADLEKSRVIIFGYRAQKR